MSRIGIAIAILIVAVFSGILLWGMFFSYIEAVSALSALKLEFMAPIEIDVDWTRGKLTVGLIGIVENTGSRDIEVEGGEYKIYIKPRGYATYSCSRRTSPPPY